MRTSRLACLVLVCGAACSSAAPRTATTTDAGDAAPSGLDAIDVGERDGESPGADAPGDVSAELPPAVSCDPVQPACGPTETCGVNCVEMAYQCTPGGRRGPGETCSKTADCMAGTQCFKYKCGVGVCRHFCNHDNECPGTGRGPGSLCLDPVTCSGAELPLRICTFDCSPTASAAAAGTIGCPAGMVCNLFDDLDRVGCDCPIATQTKLDGETCITANDCAPGLMCIMSGLSRICRPICRCDTTDGIRCAVGMNDCPPNETCKTLQGDKVYGVCEP